MAYAEKRGKGEYPWRVKFKLPDGTWDSASGFRTKTAALDHGRAQEADVRRGTYRDPKRGQIPLADWAATWIQAQDVARITLDRYSSRLRTHILPRWGATPLADIRPIDVEKWVRDMAEAGTKPNTIAVTRGLLGTILEDAVYSDLIDSNAARKRRRRGRWSSAAGNEKVWASEDDVMRVANNIRTLRGQWAFLLILTAAYTGMRWGELVGLKREFAWLDRGAIRVEWQLVEHDDGSFEEKEPKYGSRRTLGIPPFLAVLLRSYLEQLPAGQVHVFLTDKGAHPRRSAFASLTFQEAVSGREATYNGSKVRKPAVPAVVGAAGMTPHGLRHGHKVWIDEAGAARVAAEARMGHRLQGIEGTYSHVSKPMEAAIVAGLQARWEAMCRAFPDLVAEVPPEALPGDHLPSSTQVPHLKLARSA